MPKLKALIIPRNDGVAVSIDGNVTIIEMQSVQMLELAYRCQLAGLEMLRQEEREAASGRKAASHD